VGGQQNYAYGALNSTILNGFNCKTLASYSTIIGGSNNYIGSAGTFTTIIGGSSISTSVPSVTVSPSFGVTDSANVVTLSGGVATVNTALINANSIVLLTVQNGIAGESCCVTSQINGTSFSIASSLISSGSKVAWFILQLV
jgi:hypothetical protein